MVTCHRLCYWQLLRFQSSIFYGHHIFRVPTRYSRDFSSFRDSLPFNNSSSVRCANGAYLVCKNFDIFSKRKLLHPVSLYIDILDIRELFQNNLYGKLIMCLLCVVCVHLFLFVLCLLLWCFCYWLLGCSLSTSVNNNNIIISFRWYKFCPSVLDTKIFVSVFLLEKRWASLFHVSSYSTK